VKLEKDLGRRFLTGLLVSASSTASEKLRHFSNRDPGKHYKESEKTRKFKGNPSDRVATHRHQPPYPPKSATARPLPKNRPRPTRRQGQKRKKSPRTATRPAAGGAAPGDAAERHSWARCQDTKKRKSPKKRSPRKKG